MAAVCANCGRDDSGGGGCSSSLQQTQAELARTRERLHAAEAQADRLEREMAAREANQSDLAVAAVVCFALVLAIVLLLQLLRKERGARVTLTRFVHWLQRRKDP
jgi:hypothetical protein